MVKISVSLVLCLLFESCLSMCGSVQVNNAISLLQESFTQKNIEAFRADVESQQKKLRSQAETDNFSPAILVNYYDSLVSVVSLLEEYRSELQKKAQNIPSLAVFLLEEKLRMYASSGGLTYSLISAVFTQLHNNKRATQ